MQVTPFVHALALSPSSIAWSTLLPVILLAGVALALEAPYAVLFLLASGAAVLLDAPGVMLPLLFFSPVIGAARLWRLRSQGMRRPVLAGITAFIGICLAAGYVFAPIGM